MSPVKQTLRSPGGRLLLNLLPLLVVLGCSAVDYEITPVSGQVTLDGQPLRDATVTFQPVDTGGQGPAPGSYGRTDDEGRFTLRLIDPDKPGAMVGQHRVMISATSEDGDDDSGAQIQDRVPAHYQQDGALLFEVPSGGTDQADFPLTNQP